MTENQVGYFPAYICFHNEIIPAEKNKFAFYSWSQLVRTEGVYIFNGMLFLKSSDKCRVFHSLPQLSQQSLIPSFH